MERIPTNGAVAATAAHGRVEGCDRPAFPDRRPGRRSGRRRAATLLLASFLPALGHATPARAGIVLLSRQSSLQASGAGPTAAPGNFDLTGGSTSFNPFSNDLNNNADVSAANALADAHQYSVPGNSAGGLQGAYAEGTAQAQLNVPGATALARSAFGLTFQVTQGPARYNFGGAFGTAGAGGATAELIDEKAPGGPRPVFAEQVEGGPAGQDASRTLSRQGLLAPGVYDLNVWAKTPGTTANSTAYFTINLMLGPGAPASPGAGGTPTVGTPAAAPMPPAAWPGLVTLAAVGFKVSRSRRRGAV